MEYKTLISMVKSAMFPLLTAVLNLILGQYLMNTGGAYAVAQPMLWSAALITIVATLFLVVGLIIDWVRTYKNKKL